MTAIPLDTSRAIHRRRGSVLLDEADVAFKGLPTDDPLPRPAGESSFMWSKRQEGTSVPVNTTNAQPYPQADAEQRANVLEGRYQERLQHLNKLYEERLGSILEEIETIARSLRTDETIQVLKEDDASAYHVQQRVREIIDNSLAVEREKHVQRLMLDVATMDSEQAGLRGTVQRLQADLDVCTSERDNALANASAEHMASVHLMGHLRQMISGVLAKLPEKKPTPTPPAGQGLRTTLTNEYQRLLESLNDMVNHEIKPEDDEGRVPKELFRFHQRLSIVEDSLMTYETEANDAKSALQRTEIALDQCEADRTELRQKYSIVTEKVRALVAEEEQIHDIKVKELQEHIQTSEEASRLAISELEKKIEEQTEAIKRYENELSQKQNNVKEKDIQINQLGERVKETASHMRELHSMFEAYRVQTDEEIVQLKEKAEREVKLLREHHLERKAELEGKIDSLSSKLATCSQSHMLTIDHERILSEKLEQLETKYFAESRSVVDKIESESRAALAEVEVKTRGEYEEKLNVTKVECEKAIQDYSDRLSAAVAENATVKADADYTQRELDDKREALESAERELTELKKRIEQLSHDASDAEVLRGELEGLDQLVKKQSADIENVLQSRNAYQEQNERMVAQLKDAEKNAATLEAIIEEQRSHISVLSQSQVQQFEQQHMHQNQPGLQVQSAQHRAFNSTVFSLGTRMGEIHDSLGTLRRSVSQGMEQLVRQTHANVGTLTKMARGFVNTEQRARRSLELQIQTAHDEQHAAERSVEALNEELDRVRLAVTNEHTELEAKIERRKTAQTTLEREVDEDYQRTIRALKRRLEEYERANAESTNAGSASVMTMRNPAYYPGAGATGVPMDASELMGTMGAMGIPLPPQTPAAARGSEWQGEAEKLKKTVKKVKKERKELEDELDEARAALREANMNIESASIVQQQVDGMKVRVESLLTSLSSRLPIPADMIMSVTSIDQDLATHTIKVRETMEAISKYLSEIEGQADSETIQARQDVQRYSSVADESRARLEAAESQMSNLESEVRDLKAKLDMAKRESADLQRTLDKRSMDSQREIENVRAEARRETESGRQVKREVADLQEQLRIAKRESEQKYKDAQSEFRRNIETAKHEAQTQAREVDDQWRSKLRDQEAKTSDLLRDKEVEHSAEINALNDKIRILEADHEQALRRQQLQYHSRIEDLQKAQNEDVQEGDRKIILEKQRIEAEMKAKLETFETKHRSISTEIDDLKSKLNAKTNECEMLTKKCGELEALRDKLSSALRDARAKLEQRDRAIKELLSKKRRFLSAAAEKDKEISELHGLLEQAFDEVGDRSTSLAESTKLRRESMNLARAVSSSASTSANANTNVNANAKRRPNKRMSRSELQ